MIRFEGGDETPSHQAHIGWRKPACAARPVIGPGRGEASSDWLLVEVCRALWDTSPRARSWEPQSAPAH